MIRKPMVAGQFYPSDPEELKKLIDKLWSNKQILVKEKTIACILPHAGYIYSGIVAAEVLAAIESTETYIILGPNHTGHGEMYSIENEGIWQTPLGNVNIDTTLANELIKNSLYLAKDSFAHVDEHSIEVQLPFIQRIHKKDFTFVPIVLAYGGDLIYKDISDAIVKSITVLKKRVTIIASSDMTHYESQTSANHKDEEAIKAIIDLDEKLSERINTLNITMCGYAPVIIAIMAAKKLGAKHASLVLYKTSGDTTGDYSSVVGYAGIVIQ